MALTDTAAKAVAKQIGRRIQSARIEADMSSPQALADRIGGSASRVESWEGGKSKPKHETLVEISKLTDKPVAWFYGEGPDKETPAAALSRLAREVQGVGQIIGQSETVGPPSDDPSLLRHRPGFAALTADAELRRDLEITEAHLEALGIWSIPLEQLPGSKAELVRVFHLVKDLLPR